MKNWNEAELKHIKEIKRKYLQLGREMLGVYGDGDARHSHSKLGCFMEDFFGSKAWRQSLNDPSDEVQRYEGSRGI